ncbi:DMT family transporter, partial [Pyxidicoccus fallax]|uniref:DMT family transporter n=1 Tax=Pyxidicoccus fallax TaxID=394095 RepID=UPI001494F8FA|nr:DMT family transporter [Pyxidicoccus fallax]
MRASKNRWVLPERYRGIPLLVFSSFLFSLMALCTRMLSGRLSPGQVASGRFVIGLLFLAAYFPLLGRKPRYGRLSLWALRGIFGGAAVYLYFMAIDRMTVGPAVLLNSCWPIYAAIIGWLFLRERVTGPLLAGLVLTTVGAGLVMWSTMDVGASLSMGLGAWAGMGSAVLGGAAVVVVRALRH